jgi:hypothetical protein
MLSLAHIVNPVAASEDSDLGVAQPITFESMRVAKRVAEGEVGVRQLVACYPEDLIVAPADFEQTRLLDRSALDFGSFAERRKLPLLADILDRLHEASAGCSHLVYTNVDIALMPSFYLTAARLIEEGHDALVINRRTIDGARKRVSDLPLMYADIGERHGGFDCFVFRRDAYPKYRLGAVCLGVPPVGWALLLNLVAFAERFRVFKNLHATFHLGDDRPWKSDRLTDLREFNRREAKGALLELEREIPVAHRSERFTYWSRMIQREWEQWPA